MTPKSPQVRTVAEELAARCESATGPSRELDVLIGAAIDLAPEGMLISLRESLRLGGMARMIDNAESHQNVWRTELPRYTGSIDAAIGLVPEGLKLRMGIGTLMGKYSAVTEIVRGNAAELLVSFVGETVATADAATPALALCAAALRARALTMTPEKGGAK